MLDSLVQLSVEGVLTTPPPSPDEGSAYLVAAPATDDWVDKAGQIAVRIGSAWQYIAPRDGMMLFNQATGQNSYYKNGWQTASEPASPAGGATVDAEARTAIEGLIQALRNAGVFA